MGEGFPLLPESASTFAAELNLLFGYLTAVSLLFAGLIFTLVVAFAIRFRRRSEGDRPQPREGDLRLEALWTLIPLAISLSFFGWGADLFFRMKSPPADPLEIYVVGKQWMWKVQHQEGPREINELHVPLGQPVKLTMTSEDVIHSFYVPAFRVKQDVLPGRYTTLWFEATRTGEFHLFCAEYCGTEHSLMGGRVVVMSPVDYQIWLGGGRSGESLAEAGARLYDRLGCNGCHDAGPTARGPLLEGLYGSEVTLAGGDTAIADEAYLREAIVEPGTRVTAGYDAIMPAYAGQISEEGLLQIIAHIRSLGGALSLPGPGEPGGAQPSLRSEPGGGQ
jgi:cytochrome c oxidase subunit 2